MHTRLKRLGIATVLLGVLVVEAGCRTSGDGSPAVHATPVPPHSASAVTQDVGRTQPAVISAAAPAALADSPAVPNEQASQGLVPSDGVATAVVAITPRPAAIASPVKGNAAAPAVASTPTARSATVVNATSTAAPVVANAGAPATVAATTSQAVDQMDSVTSTIDQDLSTLDSDLQALDQGSKKEDQ